MKTLIINIITRLSALFGMSPDEFVPQLLTSVLEAFPDASPIGCQSKRKTLINSLTDEDQIYILKPNGNCIYIPGSTDNTTMSTFLPQAREMFANCSFIKIEDGTTKIQTEALAWCANIEQIIIPETVIEIGNSAFLDTSLARLIIPDTVTEIGDGFCRFCRALAEVHLPESITKIPSMAFDGCKALYSINIPDSVKSIEKGAFCDCDKLPDTIRQKILNIGGPEAFKN